MKFKLTPDKGTLKTNLIERTIGRAVSLSPTTQPFGPASQDLLGDVFHAMYDSDMEPIEKKDVPKSRLINHALMNWMKNDEEFMEAREKTKGKLAHSLVSSKLLYEYLLTDEAIIKALQVQEEEEKQQPQEGEGDEGDEGGEGGSGIGDALGKLESLSKNVIGSRIMSLGAKKAEEQADKADKAMKSWGVGPGDVNLSNIDEIMKIVDQNDSKLKQIADLAGRLESVVARALEKARDSFIGQVVDTKRTQDPNMIYGSELCYLMSPDVPPLIHAKYVTDFIQSGLMGFEVHSEGKELGSLYIMVDGSGSMNGSMEVHAKAIAIGLARALNRDSLNNRIYSLNTFSSRDDTILSVNSTEDWKAHYDWAQKFQGGGTDFDMAIERSIKDIREMPDGTDLVFITDGECRMHDQTIKDWEEFKSETGTRLLYVDVSGQDNTQVRKMSDMYLRVDAHRGNIDFIADDIATKLAENMETARLKKADEDDQ